MNELINNSQIVIPGYINRNFVQNHIEYIFVYSIDIQLSRIDGQPYEFAGEPNTFPVPTLVRYCPSQKTFFDDNDFTRYANIMDESIDKIAQQAFISKRPVIPCPKIGMGCSRLHEIAPKLFKYLTERLNLIKYPDIKFVYK